METVKLGHSDLTVSRIGIGCEPLGGSDWGVVDHKAAVDAIAESLTYGVNVFDTADIYGLGRSEELLAEALGSARDDAVIVSKVGIRALAAGAGNRATTYLDGSARWVTQAVEQSLRRLRIKTLPLYLVHWPDPRLSVAETIGALDQCRREGKVRYIGVSNFSAEQLQEAHRTAPITAAEVPYNLLNREVEREIFPLCEKLGISVISYGSLAQGLLTGKYQVGHEFDLNDRRHRLSHFQRDARATSAGTLQRLQRLSRDLGKSMAQVAIRWVLDNTAVSCALVGAKTTLQVVDNISAADWKLSSHDRAYLEPSK